MNSNRLLDTVTLYRHTFRARGIGVADHPHDELHERSFHGLRHCHGMLDRIEGFVAAGKLEKANRWLGFVQGYLWSQQFFTLEELREHNRI